MMNPRTKEFEAITEENPAKDGWPVFKIGDEVKVSGVVFSIHEIRKRDIVLRPLQDVLKNKMNDLMGQEKSIGNRAARRKRLKK